MVNELKGLGIPVAVITNGSLLWREDVREDLSGADWVSVKVDTVDEETWRAIDRPHGGLVQVLVENPQALAIGHDQRLRWLVVDPAETVRARECEAAGGLLHHSPGGVHHLLLEARLGGARARGEGQKGIHGASQRRRRLRPHER
jgi:hypothetical protein